MSLAPCLVLVSTFMINKLMLTRFSHLYNSAFASLGTSQVGNFVEAFSTARVAVFEAKKTINRRPGRKEEIIYKPADEIDGSSRHSRHDVEKAEMVVQAILPKFEIDSSSDKGMKPPNVSGHFTMQDVHFKYPTRPNEKVLNGINADIASGQTVAFVGPSGGGKSTIVAMLERFYEPLSGSIELDGINLKAYNVKYLRSLIGYVGQEPTLFATSIRGNIRYGNPDATEEQIIEAAKMANAHDFISAFSDGYDTQVGDKGSQLSGGQKQRIAIGQCVT
jgi:ATP-binding cassette, subfamily B (MDR/TAP), member 1